MLHRALDAGGLRRPVHTHSALLWTVMSQRSCQEACNAQCCSRVWTEHLRTPVILHSANC